MSRHRPNGGPYERHFKRTLDFLIAGAAMVLLLPVQGVVALLVRRKLGTPVIFRQSRPGLAEQPFQILKFRTMTDSVDGYGNPLADEARVTPFGRVLRSTSLDEMPELWNVIKGDMSLVGPRPLLMKYLPLYTPEQARRHDVRPGLTGWAQVNGRNSADWDAKFAMDTWYVDNISLWLDVRILAKTVGAVVGRTGINADGHATAPEFTPMQHPKQHAQYPETGGRGHAAPNSS